MNARIKEILIISIISFAFAFVYNAFSATGLPLFYEKPQVKSDSTADVLEAKKMNEDSNFVFLDARPARFFKREHIPGAVNVPYNTKEMDKLISPYEKDQNFVVYCYSEKCNMAKLLKNELTEKEFTHVYLFDKGIKAWKEAGYPTEKAED